MSDETSGTPSVRSAATTLAPLMAMGATWFVRKAMVAVYESATGKPAPVIHNREASIAERVAWAATMGATVAVIEIVVLRALESSKD